MISTAQSTSCSSFPHLLKDTTLRHIDVYNDYLALAGAYLLNHPYLALKSISTSGKYYWAKVLSLKTETYFYGV
jgi:hypothetical protein